MVCSLHSHSGQFCLHARGNLEEVVVRAIELGFTTYGLSEHMPRYRQQDLYPEELEATTVEGLTKTFDDYVKEARRLQEKYKDQISILVGAETENIYEDTIGHVKQLRSKYSLDYLVGSVHHVNEVPIDFDMEMFREAVVKAGGLDQLFEGYYDAQYRLLVEVKPEIVGHFDLINMFCVKHPLTPAVEAKMRRNVEAAVAYGAFFELNSSAFRKSLPGAHPQANVVQMIKDLGGKFTLSDDSHGPLRVANNYPLLLDYLKKTGVTEIYHLKRTEQGLAQVKVDNIQDHPFWLPLQGANL